MIKCGFAPMLWATIMRGQEVYNYAWNRVYNIILRVRASFCPNSMSVPAKGYPRSTACLKTGLESCKSMHGLRVPPAVPSVDPGMIGGRSCCCACSCSRRRCS